MLSMNLILRMSQLGSRITTRGMKKLPLLPFVATLLVVSAALVLPSNADQVGSRSAGDGSREDMCQPLEIHAGCEF